ncbi:hypothetical protein NP233_g9800 [Leucocoprinus birnbaumii]|uniref:Nephrocystin 3-like N-terminal domain-containing protein n=1 Tax=Leucocoprinus birnbaumii TaxID=56174 RepID=A0AAD5VK65_9AGAR|nr:hypothetical protein NP233_g9800 [Leucocoprinus birnbaumii]
MSFQGANNFTMVSPIFVSHTRSGPSGIDVLREASYREVAIDSGDSNKRRCFPGTREQYIADITSWASASDGNVSSSIFWMKGPAGVGKTSIAQTCAEELKKTGHLGAAFFFSVIKYDDPTRLFTTIAYQLSTILPDFRSILDDKIYNDKTLVTKSICSQFQSLIVEPLKELEIRGRRASRKVIFIDGLDECAGMQAEIIEIIAASARENSTPFCWAIFSRPEPRIASTFDQANVACITHNAELPISRDGDKEIEMYLRGGFKNILRQINGLHLAASWPTEEDIKKLVDAAAGLFAHSAAILHFVAGKSADPQCKERLQDALKTFSHTPSRQSTSPYALLDALYTLIMERIPSNILHSTQLLFCWLLMSGGFSANTLRVTLCTNHLGISETAFRSICHYLYAVVAYHEFPELLNWDDLPIDLKRPFDDQGQVSGLLEDHLFRVHGYLSFRHKSFYDFLIDPSRSSNFCVTTPAIFQSLFDSLVKQHLHFASSYAIRGAKLILAPNVHSSSISLSWPQGTEFVDSFLKIQSFCGVSIRLSHDHPEFKQLLQIIPLVSLKKLADLDYRKYLLADIMLCESPGGLNPAMVVGYVGAARVLPHTAFGCLRGESFDAFNSTAFLEMVDKLKEAGIIRAYHPQIAAPLLQRSLSSRKSREKSFGRYKLGHSERSVIWYWKFDTTKRFYRDFRTVDYTQAMKIYKTEKSRMWDEPWMFPI